MLALPCSEVGAFGSAAQDRDTFTIGDLDFLVDFTEANQMSRADAYFGLLESLQKLFNKPVDLVMLSAVKNPYLLESIEKDRKILYAA
jgi:uncharacterized protein